MKSFLSVASIVMLLGLSGCVSKVEKDFMKTCSYLTGGLDEKACECVYDKLEDEYGEKLLKKMDETGYLPSDFQDKTFRFSAECVKD